MANLPQCQPMNCTPHQPTTNKIATYPLGFHLFVLLGSEIPLRIMLKNRGFQKRHVGPVAYYHFAGAPDDETDSGSNKKKKMPIVFIHGIGIGLIAYIQLIDYFLETGRPILLPEIPYVSGFRPWQGPNSVLSPAVVASTVSFLTSSTMAIAPLSFTLSHTSNSR